MNENTSDISKKVVQKYAPLFQQSFVKHKSEPHVTLTQHIQRTNLVLGKRVCEKYRIYLDINYWIYLRDAAMGRPSKEVHLLLLNKLSKLAQYSRIICPVSDILLSELLTQSDAKTRTATVGLMDLLSEGITIASFPERINSEILYWIRGYTFNEESLHPVGQLIWTRASHFFGHIFPSETALSQEDEKAVQKAFFDTMGSMSLTEVFETIGHNNIASLEKPPTIFINLNEGKFNNLVSGTSFKDLLLDEVRGCVDACWPHFLEVFAYLSQTKTGMIPVAKNEDEIRIMTSNLIVAALNNEKMGTYLSTLRILAGTHAVVRWDPKRKYKSGDWMDFKHAAIALPYYNAFFTDHSLAAMICNRPLEYDRLYNMRIISREEDALSLIEKL